jgi:hypothetical protein
LILVAWVLSIWMFIAAGLYANGANAHVAILLHRPVRHRPVPGPHRAWALVSSLVRDIVGPASMWTLQRYISSSRS